MSQRIDVADTAKMVRQSLAKAFPGQTFRVRSKRYSGGASVHVDWTDGPTVDLVDRVVHRFEGAEFDAMQDLKTYKESTLDGRPVHFGADWVHTCRRESTEVLNRALIETCTKYDLNAADFEVIPATPNSAAYLKDNNVRIGHEYAQWVIYRAARRINCYRRPA